MPALPKNSVIGVVGAGAMGSGIAQVAATAGHNVLLFDSREGAAASALDAIGKGLDKLVEKTKISAPERTETLARIKPCATVNDFAPAELVIEAIIEDLATKKTLLQTIQSIVGAEAILVSNTSSLSITELAAGLANPSRFAGLHFFNPAPIMALVEVVAGLNTAPQTIETLRDTAKAWGKEPVISKDAPGFIVNRGARPFYGEATKFVEEGGADFVTTDTLIKSQGFRMGPFELIDLVGLGINLIASQTTFNAYHGERRYMPSSLVEQRVAAGMLGRKTNQGFYSYPSEEPQIDCMPKCKPPSEVVVHGEIGAANALFQISRQAGVEIDRTQGDGWMMLDGLKLALSDGRMAAERGPGWAVFDLALDWEKANVIALAASANTDLSLAAGYFQALGKQVVRIADLPGMLSAKTICMLINEACESLLNGVASKEDIDLAMKKGLNFPGGPFEWADMLGLDYVVRVLDNVARSYGDPRYRASVLLRRMSLNGEKFYA